MMDHPEPILDNNKRMRDIPQCRKGLTLDEAKTFIEQIMKTFHSLEDMQDLHSMYETGKQLSRAFFDCSQYRSELAQHLTSLDYPAFASKMMKKLNNMGVFKNDDIWFSSFYFYNTAWNFSETWPEFATALGTAGLPNLLNLNIGHQPYLENLASKNVYYLIKASLSIIHNIARVPSNVHYFNSEVVKQALLHLSQRDEEFLKCVSTLCLAYILSDAEANLLTSVQVPQQTQDSLHTLLGYVAAARASEKRRCHGFQVGELLSALAIYSVNDSIKGSLLTATVTCVEAQKVGQQQPLVEMLKELIEVVINKPEPALSVQREGEEAMKVMLNLAVGPQAAVFATQLNAWHTDLLNDAQRFAMLPKSLARCLEMLVWRLTTGGQPRNNPLTQEQHPLGLVMLSHAALNKVAADRLFERIKMNAFKMVGASNANSGVNCNTELSLAEACSLGMTGLQAGCTSQLAWLDQMDAASIVIICVSDVYRQNAACRIEAEYVQQHASLMKKHLIFVNLQAKYKPTGWLQQLVSSCTTPQKPPIDFSGKRDLEASYDGLVEQIDQLYTMCKVQHLAMNEQRMKQVAAVTRAKTPQRDESQQMLDQQQPMPNNTIDEEQRVMHNFVPVHSRSTLHLDNNHLDGAVPVNPSYAGPASYPLPMPIRYDMVSTHGVSQPIVRVWKMAVRPEIRGWSASKVAQWLKFRGLSTVLSNLAGGLDGVMLSQLVALRISAPEAFQKSLIEDMGLSLTDRLKLLEALDDLAPDDESTGNVLKQNGDGGQRSNDDMDEAYEKYSTISGPAESHHHANLMQ